MVPPGKFSASDGELYEAAYRRIKNDKTSLTTDLSLINEGSETLLSLTLWPLNIRVVVLLPSTPVLGRETNQSESGDSGLGNGTIAIRGRVEALTRPMTIRRLSRSERML